MDLVRRSGNYLLLQKHRCSGSMSSSSHCRQWAKPWLSTESLVSRWPPCTGSAMAAQASCSLAPPESTVEPFYPTHRTLRAGALAALPSGAAPPAPIRVLSVFSRNSLAQPCGRVINNSVVLLTAAALGTFQTQAIQKHPLVHQRYPSKPANNWSGITSWVASQQTLQIFSHIVAIHIKNEKILLPLLH